MNLGKMAGTPWHIEQMHRGEDEDRRYKGRCKYYEHKDNECKKRNGKCIGSSHCEEYVTITDEEFKRIQQKRNTANTKKCKGEDDVFWY